MAAGWAPSSGPPARRQSKPRGSGPRLIPLAVPAAQGAVARSPGASSPIPRRPPPFRPPADLLPGWCSLGPCRAPPACGLRLAACGLRAPLPSCARHVQPLPPRFPVVLPTTDAAPARLPSPIEGRMRPYHPSVRPPGICGMVAPGTGMAPRPVEPRPAPRADAAVRSTPRNGPAARSSARAPAWRRPFPGDGHGPLPWRRRRLPIAVCTRAGPPDPTARAIRHPATPMAGSRSRRRGGAGGGCCASGWEEHRATTVNRAGTDSRDPNGPDPNGLDARDRAAVVRTGPRGPDVQAAGLPTPGDLPALPDHGRDARALQAPSSSTARSPPRSALRPR